MKEDIKNQAKRILQAINYKMGIKGFHLCLCGSGKKYKNCCDKKNSESIISNLETFKKILEYKKSQGDVIQKVPSIFFKKISETSLKKFNCLYPNCEEKPVLCHSIPSNILRKNFGDHCLEAKPQDSSLKSIFVETGYSEAGVLHVFCSKHDCSLFSEIDKLEIDSKNRKQIFLLAFKAISFSYRDTQYLIGIDSQAEILRPFLFLENQKDPSLISHVELPISKHLCEQYLRLNIKNDIFKESVETLESKKYENFSYFYRSFNYEKNIFFSSFINPTLDLYGNKINHPKEPINMAINIFTKNKKIHIFLSAPPKSKKAYKRLFKQLKNTKVENFTRFINETINSAPNKPLLPLDFDFKKYFIETPRQ